MAYATKEDVTADLSFSFSTTTNPTGTQVDGFLSDVSGDIDSVLGGMGYNSLLPISSSLYPRTFGKLKNIAILGASADVWNARTKGAPGVSEKERNFRDRFEKSLTNLRKFPGDISVELDSGDGNISLPTGQFLETTPDDDLQDARYTVPDKVYLDERY